MHPAGSRLLQCEYSLSISAEFHQEAREKGSLCTNQEAGDSSVLHRDASALFQFRRVWHYFFIRPSTEKKKALCICAKEDTILKFL